jgi:hypothetical protein
MAAMAAGSRRRAAAESRCCGMAGATLDMLRMRKSRHVLPIAPPPREVQAGEEELRLNGGSEVPSCAEGLCAETSLCKDVEVGAEAFRRMSLRAIGCSSSPHKWRVSSVQVRRFQMSRTVLGLMLYVRATAVAFPVRIAFR